MSIKGDFISFTYNGVHSTELGIVRTSSSNRYNDQLVPTSQDKTVAVPGGNGTYFFGSYYTQRTITLDIAYDEVTEETLRRMRKVFESDTIHPLIFDDAPYKVYYAKVQNQPVLKYIPFQNYDNDFLNGTPRIYKGEGTINFICYDPFAHCPYDRKYLYVWNKSVVLTANDFEQGSIATETGLITNHQTRVRTKKEIKVDGKYELIINVNSNLQYYKCFEYDKNHSFISNSGNWKQTNSLDSNNIYTLKNNTKYVKIVLANEITTSGEPITPEDIEGNVIFKNTREVSSYNYKYDNKDEWNLSAHLLNTNTPLTGINAGYDNKTDMTNRQAGAPWEYILYNPGDIEADYRLIIPFGNCTSIDELQLVEQNSGYTEHLKVNFSGSSKTPYNPNIESSHVCFDSKTNLIEELIRTDSTGEYRKTGKVYNECLDSVVWFKIPIMETEYVNGGWQRKTEEVNGESRPIKDWRLKIILKDGAADITNRPTLYYDYLYY